MWTVSQTVNVINILFINKKLKLHQKTDSGRFGRVVAISACRGPGAPPDKASYTVVQKLPDYFFKKFN